MKKRGIGILLAIAMLLVFGAATAFAAGSDTSISVAASKTTPEPGEDVTVTFTLNNPKGKAVDGVEFSVAVSGGLTYKSCSRSTAFQYTDFSEGRFRAAVGNSSTQSGQTTRGVTDTTIVLLTVTYTVNSGAGAGTVLPVKVDASQEVDVFTSVKSGSDWTTEDLSCDVSSASVDLTVRGTDPGTEIPVITSHPADVEKKNGEQVKLIVQAEGSGTLTYQWRMSKDGGKTWSNSSSSGNKTNTLTFTAKTEYSGRMFCCVVSQSGGGSVISRAATLRVSPNLPVITGQPTGQTVEEGEKATFKVTASGTGLSYQWQVSKDSGGSWKNCTSSGNTSATFGFTTKSSYTGWRYRCMVSNTNGSVYTQAALLTVTPIMPAVTKQPADVKVAPGEKASFTVTATGSGTLLYQWQVSKDGGSTWKNCISTGYNTRTLSFTAKTSYGGWRYRCIVSNERGSISTEAAVLTVTGVSEPVITGQTPSVKLQAGATAKFTVEASGEGLSYQWQVSKDGGSTWKNCTSSGYDTKTLQFTAKLSYSGWLYRCRVKNSGGEAVSLAAPLTVIDPYAKPEITKQPVGQSVTAGSRAVFMVTASGTGLTYQWQVSKDGGASWKDCTSSGNDMSTFGFTAKASYSGWQYRCIVTNANGSVTSTAATLTVG